MADYDNLYDLAADVISTSSTEMENIYDDKDIATNKNRIKWLRSEIQKNLKEYYSAYDPISYERTYALLAAMTYVKFDKANGVFTIEFNDDAYHPNLSGGKSFVPMFVNFGWEWKNVPNQHGRPRRPRSYQYYRGSGYITKAIKDFNKKYANKGLKAQLIINGIPTEDWGPYTL